MNSSGFLRLVLASLLGGIVAVLVVQYFKPNSSGLNRIPTFSVSSDTQRVQVPDGLNFVQASKSSKPAVVHIKSHYKARPQSQEEVDIFDFFGQNPHDFRNNPFPNEGSGSGVIISADGYIVTNHHVIENADKILVIMDDRRTFEAELIGKDPSTDLAVLKIKAENLPYLPFGNSDRVQLGEWVLAIGNPLDLISTITAGIVSAKARNINLLRTKDNLQVESFIQTDAAVNPGNSGGALVNLKGELIGINTAIASQTGGYTGYSFAVPSLMVKKVVEDLLAHGEVQRGLLGVNIQDVTQKQSEEAGLNKIGGVFVAGVNKQSAAEKAGILPGDIILSVNGVEVNTASELQEQVARLHPGDKVKVGLIRKKQPLEKIAVLKNKMGSTQVVTASTSEWIEKAGISVRAVNEEEIATFGISTGLKIVEIKEGKFKKAGIPLGFIITKVAERTVEEPADLEQLLSKFKGGLLVEGLLPNGQKAYFAVAF